MNREENKRNTAKAKARNNRRYPYKSKIYYINKPGNYKIIDKEGKVWGEFRILSNAEKEKDRLERDLWLKDLKII